MKVLTVIGTRPEAIKMAPLLVRLSSSQGIQSQLCVTAQHREMLDQVLDVFGVVPDFDLNLMRAGQTLVDVTSGVLQGVYRVLQESRPNIVLVHGDTATTLASSLAAYYSRIPVGHVEAGLRTGDLYAPWPEEANRKLTAGIAELHFAPTQLARENLVAEGFSPSKVFITGNTVIDALNDAIAILNESPNLTRNIEERFNFLDASQRVVLVTGHRRENFGDGFDRITQALRMLAESFSDVQFVYPVHLNPNVLRPVTEALGSLRNFHLISPLEYLPFVWMMRRASLILTDSGGIQEEAPALGKRVLVMREVTERPEALTSGLVSLVGTDVSKIVVEATAVLQGGIESRAVCSPYGDGKACDRIIEQIRQHGIRNGSWKEAKKEQFA